MDRALTDLLEQLAREGLEHDAREPEHRRRLLNLEPPTAALLGILVRSGRRTRVLEIGTSNGYSTIWLADAVRATGGRVTSIERNPARQAEADANLRRAGLRALVELIAGDATEALASLSGPFDCVFFDADRVGAPAQLAALRPMLTPDALLLADNALSHPDELAGYLAAIAAMPDVDAVTVPIGKGLSVALLRAHAETFDRPERR